LREAPARILEEQSAQTYSIPLDSAMLRGGLLLLFAL